MRLCGHYCMTGHVLTRIQVELRERQYFVLIQYYQLGTGPNSQINQSNDFKMEDVL